MSRKVMVSLFSGAGGLDLGFRDKFDIVFANDLLKAPMRTYSRNFGLKYAECRGAKVEATRGEALVCDVESVDFTTLKGEDVDVIVGAPPCQDFSLLRGPNRKGIEVKRGRLYTHFVRALVALQPKAFVFENVPGLVSSNEGLAYKTILEDFSKLNLRWHDAVGDVVKTDSVQGYELLFWEVVDLASLGVPQSRERLFIIGIRKDLLGNSVMRLWKAKAEVDKALSGSSIFRKYPLTTMETFEGRRLDELGDKYREVMKEWEGVWDEVATERARKWKTTVWDRLTFDPIKDYLFVQGIPEYNRLEVEKAMEAHEAVLKELGYYGKSVDSLKLPDGTTDDVEDTTEIKERMRHIPPDEYYLFVEGTKWEVKGKMSHVYRRIHPLKPSYTIIAYGGGGTLGYHYARSRATLKLREKARLQAFPDDFLFEGTKVEIRAQIGEAVPPLASKRIAEAVSKILEELKA